MRFGLVDLCRDYTPGRLGVLPHDTGSPEAAWAGKVAADESEPATRGRSMARLWRRLARRLADAWKLPEVRSPRPSRSELRQRRAASS